MIKFEARLHGDVWLPALVGSPEGDHVGGKWYPSKEICQVACDSMHTAYHLGREHCREEIREGIRKVLNATW